MDSLSGYIYPYMCMKYTRSTHAYIYAQWAAGRDLGLILFCSINIFPLPKKKSKRLGCECNTENLNTHGFELHSAPSIKGTKLHFELITAISYRVYVCACVCAVYVSVCVCCVDVQIYWILNQSLLMDWCCFCYFVRNSLVALLEALCARYFMCDLFLAKLYSNFESGHWYWVHLLWSECIFYRCVEPSVYTLPPGLLR